MQDMQGLKRIWLSKFIVNDIYTLSIWKERGVMPVLPNTLLSKTKHNRDILIIDEMYNTYYISDTSPIELITDYRYITHTERVLTKQGLLKYYGVLISVPKNKKLELRSEYKEFILNNLQLTERRI
jgi:hypothetical protein